MFQKSRLKWVQSGDRNTTFYHTTALVRRRRNKVASLKLPSGDWCDDQDVLKVCAADHFKALYATDDDADRIPPQIPEFPATFDSNSSILWRFLRQKLRKLCSPWDLSNLLDLMGSNPSFFQEILGENQR